MNSAPTAAPCKPGRARVYPALSCITFNPAGGYAMADMDCFDVPGTLNFDEGCLAGMKLVWELFLAARKEEDFDSFDSVIAGAVAARNAPEGPGSASRRGVAIGFLETLQDVLLAVATSGFDVGAIVAERITWHERASVTEVEKMRAANAEFINGMRAEAVQS